MPRVVTKRARAKLAAGVLGSALAAAACAPASRPPNFPISQVEGFQIQVVDSAQDVGRAPSVTLDPKGNPAITYLLVTPAPTPGVLPQPLTPGVPQPPSVVLATGDLATGIWNRTAVSGQNAVGKAEGLAPEVAGSKGFALPNVDTGLAIDAQGKHHVVWSTPSGLFYADDVSGSFSATSKIAAGQTFGASIAVGPDGVLWVSFVQGSTVKAGSRTGASWKIEDVGKATGAVGMPADATAVKVAVAGKPVVAFGDNGRTMVARKGAGGWKAEAVGGPGGYAVSLGLAKSGETQVAYYDQRGVVHLARSTGSGPWEVTLLGSTAFAPSRAGDPRWSTGIGLFDTGADYTWADTLYGQIAYATIVSGKLTAEPLPSSQSGANPSIAVSADGKTVVIAWFDLVNVNLNVATTVTGGLAIAHPTPTLHQPSLPPPTAACKPSGTSLSIAAPPGASANGFDKNCLAAPVNTAVTLTFTNSDPPQIHNVEIFSDSSATKRLGGATGPTDTIPAGQTTTYRIDALPAGSYYFHCDIHPTTMTGTFIVAK